MISVHHIGDPASDSTIVITLAAPTRPELETLSARQLAISTATKFVGKCGIDNAGNWGYINPPNKEHPTGELLSDAQLSVTGGMQPGGMHLQEFKIRGSL